MATVRTVSNDPAHPAQFIDIQDAINSASPGDSIYVQGSNNYYNSFTLLFKLTIVGPGFSAQKQDMSKAMINPASSINIGVGSSGSSIQGMYIKGGIQVTGYSSDISYIQLIRNYIGGLNTNSASSLSLTNWVIQNNYFDPVGHCINMVGAAVVSNWLVMNNYFRATSGWTFTNFPTPGTSGVSLDHNLFAGGNGYYLMNYVSNFSLSNNIFFGNYFDNAENISNCIYFNNVTFNTYSSTPWTTGTGNTDGGGNLVNTNPLMVDQGTVLAGAVDLNGNYQVQDASVLTGASDGTAIGLYGGNATWANARMPAFPYIFSITGSPTVPAGGTFNISINARTGH